MELGFDANRAPDFLISRRAITNYPYRRDPDDDRPYVAACTYILILPWYTSVLV